MGAKRVESYESGYADASVWYFKRFMTNEAAERLAKFMYERNVVREFDWDHLNPEIKAGWIDEAREALELLLKGE